MLRMFLRMYWDPRRDIVRLERTEEVNNRELGPASYDLTNPG